MTFHKILCPTDFSEASYDALKKAVELATPDVTELCVLHVEQPAAALSPMAGFTPYACSEAERRAVAVANLCLVLEERVPSSVRARPLLKSGEAAAQIVRAAREEGADLIVLTRHGAGAGQAAVMGSVAEAVLRTAPCSVLTINTPAPVKAESVSAAHLNGNGVYGGLRPQLEIVSSKALFLDGD